MPIVQSAAGLFRGWAKENVQEGGFVVEDGF